MQEIAIVESIQGDKAPAINKGDVIVRVDPTYFRPTEVESLLGDSSKAKLKLGWEPEFSVKQLCAEMIKNDLAQVKKRTILGSHDY